MSVHVNTAMYYTTQAALCLDPINITSSSPLSCVMCLSHLFISYLMQLPSLGSLTPRAAVCLPRLCLSPSAVTWWDSVSRWLQTQPAEAAASLEPLLKCLLPLCLEFLAPLLVTNSNDGGDASASTLGAIQLHPQGLQLHPTHLVNTCCKILEVSAIKVGTLLNK